MTSRSRVCIIASLMIILGLVGTVGFAAGQEDVRFTGYVYSENDSSPIDGARVVFQNTENPWIIQDTTTDNNGYFSIYLPSGDYTISVSADGFDTRVQDNFYLEMDTNEEFYLSPQYNDGNGGSFEGTGDGTGDGSNGDGNDGDGSEGDEENGPEDFMPSEIGNNLNLIGGLCITFFIIIFVAFLIIAGASLGIFVRLGKIRKDIDKLNQNGLPREPREPYSSHPRPSRSEAPPPPPPPPPPPRR